MKEEKCVMCEKGKIHALMKTIKGRILYGVCLEDSIIISEFIRVSRMNRKQKELKA